MKKIHHALMLITAITLGACTEQKTEEALLTAVAIEKADECHLCGMIIEGFAGPKGAVTHKTENTPRKFCSTRDMFAYYLDPEHKRNVKQLLVHDMSQVPWDMPDDELYIDAKSAWFVVGSNQSGAMGSTLASFAEKKVADAFASKYGGNVYSFDGITTDLINQF
ncbi:nitrous oxide reductase accessory protein NosL [Thalassotalea atypica]|uniref:nitrous oxide reductase accessory protein NosL n=1 Tax=Thalassotalea atypica TaxID=2054316 RepID=UPI0025745E3D|nr:nitrous oxide reductase accessory protein NosL [Thalassotalea atypica]